MSLGIQTYQGAVNPSHQQADFYRLPAASDENHYRLFQFGAGENHVQLRVPPAKRVTLFFGYRVFRLSWRSIHHATLIVN